MSWRRERLEVDECNNLILFAAEDLSNLADVISISSYPSFTCLVLYLRTNSYLGIGYSSIHGYINSQNRLDLLDLLVVILTTGASSPWLVATNGDGQIEGRYLWIIIYLL